jgi:hypothetical protein
VHFCPHLCTPRKTSRSVTHPKIALGQAHLTLEFFAGGILEKKVYLGDMSIPSILLSLESGCHIGFIFFFFVPILDFDLVKLNFALVDLRWRRWWRWVGVEVLVTSAALVGARCGGGHVGLRQLSFWNAAEGRVLCSFGDGGKGLSGWLLEWGLILIGGLG